MLTNGGRVQASSTLCNGLDLKALLKNSLGNLWKTCPMLLQWFVNSTACTQVNLAQRHRPGVLELCRISFSLFLSYFTHTHSPLSLVNSTFPSFRFTLIPFTHSSLPFSRFLLTIEQIILIKSKQKRKKQQNTVSSTLYLLYLLVSPHSLF